MKIVFATNNLNKLQEVQDLLPFFNVVGLKDIGCEEDIPETGDTLEENAKIKANFVKEKFGFNCISDDTGLEVEALNGEPGVHTARYSGDSRDPNKNMDKLLNELEGESNRKAQFRTAIALVLDDEQFVFEGVCKGEITKEKQGEKGFGYDPIFKPEGSYETFAEMDIDEKGRISHRGIAIQKLIIFLETIRY
ncbi:non-canonical purine NTP diphosphatase [Urechidicola vernalis]|uniref:dITP/XTP pyrophosphatase n=1 Tax=Urechidicola vernalis TaxID=3075600 RepID=A0ABU2Y835_9FLAO|nr:non-canonical purine NTP diphosphatase [Urechidicola sp. P050]MDT0553877.1 non-canonical purine NTP diphosphatase [Urechidicola sp. P050]